MSLEEKIRKQYDGSRNVDHLYNSEYSRRADREKEKVAKELIASFIPAPVSVLEVGAGQGDNVHLLRNCGFKEIVLNELLPDRIATARQQHPDLQLIPGNAIQLSTEQRFDCVFQSTVFTSIPAEDDRIALAGKMWQLLKPGGIILWYDFIYNNPFNPSVKKVSIAQTRALFPQSVKSQVRRVTLAPPLGRRVGKLYGFFNLPILRTHILAVFQKENSHGTAS